MLQLTTNKAKIAKFSCTCKGGAAGGLVVSEKAAWSTFFCTVTAVVFRRLTDRLRRILACRWGRNGKIGSCGAGLFRYLGVMRL